MPVSNVLVPTAFGEGSAVAVRYGQDLAVRLCASLHIPHVVENPLHPAR